MQLLLGLVKIYCRLERSLESLPPDTVIIAALGKSSWEGGGGQ